jgi:hypothetical protein
VTLPPGRGRLSLSFEPSRIKGPDFSRSTRKLMEGKAGDCSNINPPDEILSLRLRTLDILLIMSSTRAKKDPSGAATACLPERNSFEDLTGLAAKSGEDTKSEHLALDFWDNQLLQFLEDGYDPEDEILELEPTKDIVKTDPLGFDHGFRDSQSSWCQENLFQELPDSQQTMNNEDEDEDLLQDDFFVFTKQSPTRPMSGAFSEECFEGELLEVHPPEDELRLESLMDEDILDVTATYEANLSPTTSSELTSTSIEVHHMLKAVNAAFGVLISGTTTTTNQPDILVESNDLFLSLIKLAPAVFSPGYHRVCSIAFLSPPLL